MSGEDNYPDFSILFSDAGHGDGPDHGAPRSLETSRQIVPAGGSSLYPQSPFLNDRGDLLSSSALRHGMDHETYIQNHQLPNSLHTSLYPAVSTRTENITAPTARMSHCGRHFAEKDTSRNTTLSDTIQTSNDSSRNHASSIPARQDDKSILEEQKAILRDIAERNFLTNQVGIERSVSDSIGTRLLHEEATSEPESHIKNSSHKSISNKWCGINVDQRVMSAPNIPSEISGYSQDFSESECLDQQAGTFDFLSSSQSETCSEHINVDYSGEQVEIDAYMRRIIEDDQAIEKNADSTKGLLIDKMHDKGQCSVSLPKIEDELCCPATEPIQRETPSISDTYKNTVKLKDNSDSSKDLCIDEQYCVQLPRMQRTEPAKRETSSDHTDSKKDTILVTCLGCWGTLRAGSNACLLRCPRCRVVTPIP